MAWIIYSGTMCNWISYFGTVAFVAFLLTEALFCALFVYAVTSICKDLSPLFFAFSWVVFEWILSHLPVVAFPWLTFSTTMIDTPVVSFARSSGGAGVTFIISICSAGIVYLIRTFMIDSSDHVGFRVSHRWISLSLVLLLIILSLVNFSKASGSNSVAIIQGNDINRYLTQREISERYLENSHIKLAQSLPRNVDYLVFPESAFSEDPEVSARLHKRLTEISQKANRLVILNTISTTKNGDVNRNYFYSPKMQKRGTYDKKRLVPFGEYVPGNSIIGSWSLFDSIGSGFVRGKRDITVDGVTTLICFESAFSQDVRNALSDQSRVLVITTNNRSYRRSGNSEQHLALTRLRAIEFSIPVVHASISGTSAIISASGDVIDKSDLFEKSIITGTISPNKPGSFYAKTFDWLSLVCFLGIGYGCLVSLRNAQWKNRILKR